MVNKLVVAIFLSLVCNAFTLDSQYSPVLIFKNKENTKSYEKSVISATTQVEQREFEQRFGTFAPEQKVLFIYVDDLSPEDFALKNEDNVKAFQNLARGVDMVDYMPFVKNAVDNKVTQGKDVVHTKVSTIDELEQNSDAKIIVAKLPESHVDEPRHHYCERIDRAVYALSQLPQYKDYLFVLTAGSNSHLQQEHSRKRRAVSTTPPYKYNDANILFYAAQFTQDFKNEKQADTPISITGISSSKKDNTITLKIDSAFPLVLNFEYSEYDEYWSLNTATSTVSSQSLEGKVLTAVGAPKGFSFSCTSGVYFSVNDSNTNGVYFTQFQVQIAENGGGSPIESFSDSYDCAGFTTIPIWAGLFITFLLLGIVSTGITYIMDIRTMDRFDDPKGKTITVTASD